MITIRLLAEPVFREVYLWFIGGCAQSLAFMWDESNLKMKAVFAEIAAFFYFLSWSSGITSMKNLKGPIDKGINVFSIGIAFIAFCISHISFSLWWEEINI